MIDLIKDFRNSETIRGYALQIHELCGKFGIKANFMEVCGGHTHTIAKYSLEKLLPSDIRFIHGPGCPVCILPKQRVDHAVTLSEMENTILITTGDMIRVPGTEKSLEKARAEGRDVRSVYSPLDVIETAEKNPDKKVIYFAIGFETTIPSTAILVKKTVEKKLDNLFFYVSHVLVPPALEALLSDPSHNINGFLMPSHVSVITGSEIYRPFSSMHKMPVVVGGFEPADIMESVYMLVMQLSEHRHDLEIQYDRCVSGEGNTKAWDLVNQYFTPEDKFEWRGPGFIEKSSLRLRDEYDRFNAAKVFKEFLTDVPSEDHRLCLCADILRGKKRPEECRVFGTRCTPDDPLGACMVSGEGACAAYYKYGNAP